MIRLAAVAVLALCSSLQASDDRSRLLRAQHQFHEAHYEQALKLYKEARDQTGGDAALEYNIALCHLHLSDGDTAIRHFERVASQAGANAVVRRKALFNVGLVRAQAARQQLDQLMSPEVDEGTQAPPPPLDAPENIPELEAIAEALLKAIVLFGECDKLEHSQDARHNMRALRITRRNVLGLLKRAIEAKEKEDLLEDPAAYLEVLIQQQRTATGLSRHLILNPPQNARALRQARRAILRLQRQIMERTGTAAGHLAQFTESADQDTPATREPQEESPREHAYHAAAGQLEESINAQRDAAAFLMDAELEATLDQQSAALDHLHVAWRLLSQDPRKVLVGARSRQAALQESVSQIEAPTDWLQDAVLGPAPVPQGAKLEPSRTALYHDQSQVFGDVSALWMQLQMAAAGQAAGQDAAAADQAAPAATQAETYKQLADALKGVAGLRAPCLDSIAAKDRIATLAAQQRVLDMIDAALDLLPKSVEQRIAELAARQARLNQEVTAEAAARATEAPQGEPSAWDELDELAAEARADVLGTPPSELAAKIHREQDDLRVEAESVNEELGQKIAGAAPDAAGAPGANGAPPEVQAYIKASKHIDQAGFEMLVALEGLDKAMIQNTVGPMEAEGPVQTAQANALEELLLALAALRPPQDQPQDDQQDEQDQQPQEDQQDDSSEDARRAIERADQQREQAERELYQRRPRTVIKNW